MQISGYLIKDAKALAERIKKASSAPRQEHLMKKMNHIVHTLENPSKTKLQSAIETIRELCIVMQKNSEIVQDLEWLSRSIEREVPPPKKTRRRHSQSW